MLGYHDTGKLKYGDVETMLITRLVGDISGILAGGRFVRGTGHTVVLGNLRYGPGHAPEPSTVALLVMAVPGLVGLRRLRRRAV